MTTLTEFLLARIAEDEASANVAHRESMRGHASPGFVRSLVAWQDQSKDVRGRSLIGRMTPARVLADCEAKRQIVELHNPCDDWSYGDPTGCPELRALALPYADHPDYREEWRP